MKLSHLKPLGWGPFFEAQVTDELLVESSVWRACSHHGSQVVMLGMCDASKAGEKAESLLEQGVPSQLAESAGEVAVGDWVVLDGNGRAVQRLSRKTILYRKAAGEEVKPQVIATNIDTIFIVCSCNEDFNLSRIERYLALTIQTGATPVVILTKSDLCADSVRLKEQVTALNNSVCVECVDARTELAAESLSPWCYEGQSIALLGSSGVGKSTLANSLGAGGIATGSIREQDAKGRHTTTARSIHVLPHGGVLIDNPGMRELQLPACDEGVADVFEEVLQIAAACRFNNCSHQGEPGCAIAEALDSGQLDGRRFRNFIKLNAEQAHNSRSLAQRRLQDRKTGRMYKSVIAEKKRRRGQG